MAQSALNPIEPNAGRFAARFAICSLLAALMGCGGSSSGGTTLVGGGQDPDPVIQDFPVAYIADNPSLASRRLPRHSVVMANETILLLYGKGLIPEPIISQARERVPAESLSEESLVEQALKDPLTGVNNRASLDAYIKQQVMVSERHGHPFAGVGAVGRGFRPHRARLSGPLVRAGTESHDCQIKIRPGGNAGLAGSLSAVYPQRDRSVAPRRTATSTVPGSIYSASESGYLCSARGGHNFGRLSDQKRICWHCGWA